MSKQAKETMDRMKNVKMPPGGGPALRGAGALLGGGLGLAFLINSSIFSVEAGHKAVVFNRMTGLKEGVALGEGLQFRIPWFEWPTMYDVRRRPRNMSSQTGSKDLQMVSVAVRVLHRPDERKLHEIHRNLGPDYDERVLPSIVNEVCKQVVAQFDAAQLVNQRERVSQMIHHNLRARASKFNLIVEDTSITQLGFGREYQSAVERKQVAQQDAERARFIVDKAKQQKRSIVVKAQGEAEAAELMGKAMRDNDAFLKLRAMNAAQDVSKVLSRSQNKLYLNADSLLFGFVTPGAESLSSKKK